MTGITSLLQVKLTGINLTTSQIEWNKLYNKSKLNGINFTTSQIEWNKLYYKSN